MSEQTENPATPGADEPAALVPDQVTVVHQTVGEPTGSEPEPAAAPADPPSGGSRSPVPGVVPDPVVMPASAEPPAWTKPAPPQESSGGSGVAAVATDRPEVAVGAAFAGGLVLALILKRLAR